MSLTASRSSRLSSVSEKGAGGEDGGRDDSSSRSARDGPAGEDPGGGMMVERRGRLEDLSHRRALNFGANLDATVAIYNSARNERDASEETLSHPSFLHPPPLDAYLLSNSQWRYV